MSGEPSMTPPPEPRTAAGRALWKRMGDYGGEPLMRDILAIEAEAEAADAPLNVEALAAALHELGKVWGMREVEVNSDPIADYVNLLVTSGRLTARAAAAEDGE